MGNNVNVSLNFAGFMPTLRWLCANCDAANAEVSIDQAVRDQPMHGLDPAWMRDPLHAPFDQAVQDQPLHGLDLALFGIQASDPDCHVAMSGVAMLPALLVAACL